MSMIFVQYLMTASYSLGEATQESSAVQTTSYELCLLLTCYPNHKDPSGVLVQLITRTPFYEIRIVSSAAPVIAVSERNMSSIVCLAAHCSLLQMQCCANKNIAKS